MAMATLPLTHSLYINFLQFPIKQASLPTTHASRILHRLPSSRGLNSEKSSAHSRSLVDSFALPYLRCNCNTNEIFTHNYCSFGRPNAISADVHQNCNANLVKHFGIIKVASLLYFALGSMLTLCRVADSFFFPGWGIWIAISGFSSCMSVIEYFSGSTSQRSPLLFFLFFIILSRLGHKSYDVVGAQILQTGIPSSKANFIGTTEVAVASLAESVMLVVAMVANDVSHFGLLAMLSLASVVGAAWMFCRWMLSPTDEQRSLFSFDPQF